MKGKSVDLSNNQSIFKNNPPADVVSKAKSSSSSSSDEDDHTFKNLEIDSSIYGVTFYWTIIAVQQKLEINRKQLEIQFFKAAFVFFIQFLLVVLVGYSAYNGSDDLEYVRPNTTHMVLRILCVYLFHIQSQTDVTEAYKRLKFLK